MSTKQKPHKPVDIAKERIQRAGKPKPLRFPVLPIDLQVVGKKRIETA